MKYVKCQVVMLPTEKADVMHQSYIIGKNKVTNLFQIFHHTKFNFEHYTPIQLYYIHSEPLKKGDWYLVKIDGGWYKESLAQFEDTEEERELAAKFQPFKVIATTNGNLLIPRPKNDFLTAFCVAENEGESIKEVLVKYQEYLDMNDLTNQTTYLGPIVADDNTVATSKVIEKTYTKKEVGDMFRQLQREYDCIDFDSVEQFIEENLT